MVGSTAISQCVRVQYHGKVNQHPKEDQISRYPDTQRDLRPAPTMRHDCFRRFGQALVIAAALALIALTWIGARDAILAHRTEARARVQAEVVGKALAFEELLRREMLSLDQALRILEYDWQRDPTGFDLAAWSGQVGDVSTWTPTPWPTAYSTFRR